MVPTNSCFWSKSRKESVVCQQKFAFRNEFLPKLTCSNDKLNSGCNWKMLLRKRTSNLDEICLNYEQLFHPEQKTFEEKIFVNQQLHFFVKICWYSISSSPFCYLWCNSCSGNGTHCPVCLCQSWRSQIFSYFHYSLSISGKDFLFRNQLFQCLVKVAFQLQSV